MRGLVIAACVAVVVAGCTGGPAALAPPTAASATVAVAVSCVPPELGPAPVFETRQTLAAVPDGPARYARLAADWLARTARMNQTEPVVAACRKIAPPPT